MTMQQWVNVMRLAGCQITYASHEWYEGVMWYHANNSHGELLGIWNPINEAGSIIIGGNTVMSWEFNK